MQTVTVAATNQTQSDVYDASGNLLLQQDPINGATLMLGDTELHKAVGSSTVTATRKYSVAGITVEERDTATGTSTVHSLDTDINGNADLEVSPITGAVTRRWFDPFGNLLGSANGWSSDKAFLNKSTSTFTGLVQDGARAYDPTLGRFLSVDPIFNAADPRPDNGYSYSANDPITFSDLSALCLTDSGALNHYTNCAGG